VADVPSGLSLTTPREETKKKITEAYCNFRSTSEYLRNLEKLRISEHIHRCVREMTTATYAEDFIFDPCQLRFPEGGLVPTTRKQQGQLGKCL
jgi:hypothetical protein